MTAVFIAALSCAIWLYLLCARGGFWRARQRDDASLSASPEDIVWPRVVAIIPARNEASVVGETIGTLLRQNYRGAFTVIVVDDHSSDDTAAVARRAAAAAGAPPRVPVPSAPQPPPRGARQLQGADHAPWDAPTPSRLP